MEINKKKKLWLDLIPSVITILSNQKRTDDFIDPK